MSLFNDTINRIINSPTMLYRQQATVSRLIRRFGYCRDDALDIFNLAIEIFVDNPGKKCRDVVRELKLLAKYELDAPVFFKWTNSVHESNRRHYRQIQRRRSHEVHGAEGWEASVHARDDSARVFGDDQVADLLEVMEILEPSYRREIAKHLLYQMEVRDWAHVSWSQTSDDILRERETDTAMRDQLQLTVRQWYEEVQRTKDQIAIELRRRWAEKPNQILNHQVAESATDV